MVAELKHSLELNLEDVVAVLPVEKPDPSDVRLLPARRRVRRGDRQEEPDAVRPHRADRVPGLVEIDAQGQDPELRRERAHEQKRQQVRFAAAAAQEDLRTSRRPRDATEA